jgi:hypothetical protein
MLGSAAALYVDSRRASTPQDATTERMGYPKTVYSTNENDAKGAMRVVLPSAKKRSALSTVRTGGQTGDSAAWEEGNSL